MSNYVKTKIPLSEGQISKLKSAFKKGEEITLQINNSKTPNYEMYLTKTQINQINKGKRITISKTQLQKNGGFLPFLIPILTSLGLGAASGLGAWGTKKVLDKVSGKGIRQPFEGSGCKKKRGKEK